MTDGYLDWSPMVGFITSQPVKTSYEYMYESGVPGGHAVRHFKSTPLTYAFGFGTGFWSNQPATFYCHGVPADESLVGRVYKAVPGVVPWESLPTSSKHNLIVSLVEMDETIALFTKKFCSRLSYGSINWGLRPFLSDLMNVVDSISNASVGLEALPLETQSALNIRLPRKSNDVPDCDLNGWYHVAGRLSIPFKEDLNMLLDRLAFHPDIASAWDLIPLSFVVDYFIPIGNYLEYISNRGWINSVHFRGWRSFKLSGRAGINAPGTWQIDSFNPPPEENFYLYARDYLVGSVPLGHLPPPKLEIEAPSLSELFNTLYILLKIRLEKRSSPVDFIPENEDKFIDWLKKQRR